MVEEIKIPKFIETPENLPEFLKYAIGHEKKIVDLRIRQIQGYLERIKLMSAGVDYFETLKKVPPVQAGIIFEKGQYFKLKSGHKQTPKGMRKKDDKTN